MSVPLGPANPAPEAVFAGVPPPRRLYDSVAGHTLGLGEPGFRNVVPGRVFWLFAPSAATVTVSGNLVNPGAEYRLPLTPGWNGVATPWLTSVAWADGRVSVRQGNSTVPLGQAIAQGWIEGDLTDHDPASDADVAIPPNTSPPGQLAPWKGYHLFSNIQGELVFSAPPPDTEPPVVSFAASLDGSAVTAPTDIVGSVGDANLIEWRLEYAPAGSVAFTTLGFGQGPVVDGVLGRLDPTVLLNGVYTIRLTALDISGTTSTLIASVVVKGNLKVGNFTLSFVDLDVPLAGLPIRVTRTYDSRDKRRGDFGVGWRVELSDARVAESGTLGLDWEGTRSGGIFPTYCIQPTRSHIVSVTFPDNRVYEFEPVLTPQCQQIIPPQQATVSFRARPGTSATLAALDAADVFVTGPFPGTLQLLDVGTIDLYNPTVYRLTLPDGRAFVIHQQQGLQSITDLNGNQLTVSAAGIVHSGGLGVAFARDGLGRITQITDPAGSSLTYHYDAAGDLVKVTDREQHDTTFEYDGSHGLLTIRDPRGAQPIRNEYDDSGRLIRHTDALGRTIEYTHDVEGRQEIVVDRLGQATVFEYDERGNVVRQTDPDGGVTERAFDARGNRLSETNPAGETTTWTYDLNDNVTSVTDAEGHTATFTYNGRRQILTRTHPGGRLTTNQYDAKGNLTSTTDPEGKTITYTYDTRGNALTRTDAAGCVTRYEYDAAGNLRKETDGLGRERTFTYDANNRRLSESRTRTVNGTTETLVTAFAYDRQGRNVSVTHPDGAVERREYDAAGQETAVIDPLGRRTTRMFDELGRLVRVTFPDGTTEESTFDAEDRRLTSRDRAGRLTQYAYDPMGRVIRTTAPDGTFVDHEYDQAGRAISVTDERGHDVRHEYNDAGDVVKTIDAVGSVTTFAYDGHGNRTSRTDARAGTTNYEYDGLNRRTRTVFPDGSQRRSEYDPIGRVVSETDAAGKVTRFTYDCLGQILTVTDAGGQVTTYGYDEVGNRITETDANGRTTRYEYDRRGRPTRRILAGGAFERREYDLAGNLTRRVDFSGQAATYTYDVNNRLTSRSNPDDSSASFTYTATGRRASATDSRGATQYQYDLRDRLTRMILPDGRRLDYGYDPRGNRTSMTAVAGASTFSSAFAYDAASRLTTVTDPGGRAYTFGYDPNGNRASLAFPNGVATSYTYDSLNRLTRLETKLGVATIASFAYTLGLAGNRVRVDEHDGSSRAYEYDPVYRLTQETVAGPDAYVKSFTYDAVGNRLNQTDSRTGAVAYTYDARDRLLTEGASVYQWDENGNLLTRSGADGAAYLWDFEGRLREVTRADGTVVSHGYDADGVRVRTAVTPPGGTAQTTNYLVDTAGELSQVVLETDGAGLPVAYYVRADDLLAILRGAAVRFAHADGLGSIRRLTDAAGNVTDSYAYTAFGELLAHLGSDPNPYRFAGEQHDPNSGFYYLRARYYAPGTGGFISLDQLPGNIFDPRSLHRYTYAHADPVDNTDPTGNFSIGSMVTTSAIIGTLAGGVMGYLQTGSIYGAVVGAVLGATFSVAATLGVALVGYGLAAGVTASGYATMSVGTGLGIAQGGFTFVAGFLGVRQYINAENEEERTAAMVGLALLVASMGVSRAMAPRQMTVIGGRQHVRPLYRMPGFNGLDPDGSFSEAQNIAWLREAIARGDVIMARVNPQAWANFLASQTPPKTSWLNTLEIPLLRSEGFFPLWRFWVRW